MPKVGLQSGNALVIILITIALFAALMFTFTRSSNNGSTKVLSDSDSQLVATEILDYARDIEGAVNRLVARGCSENEISFDYDSDNDGNWLEDNTSSPADFSCHVVYPQTGGGHYVETSEAQDRGWMLRTDVTYPGVIAPWAYMVDGVGEDSNHDLIWFIPSVSREVCLQINTILGVDNPSGNPPRDTTGSAIEGIGFNGETSPLMFNEIDAPELSGRHTGCYVTDDQAGASNAYDGTDYYYFYHVLLAR